MTENENGTKYSINDFADIKGLSRDRPWLLPSVSVIVCIDTPRVGALAETIAFVLEQKVAPSTRDFAAQLDAFSAVFAHSGQSY